MLNDCVPAVYSIGEKKGQVIRCEGSGARKAREALIARDGPPPFPKAVCRHLCKNDSEAPNGFVCTLHTVWGTQKENSLDRDSNDRKKGGKKSGKEGGKTTMSISRTCPHCSKTMKGAVYFKYHGDNCKMKPTS
jgi:hypothetical protein